MFGGKQNRAMQEREAGVTIVEKLLETHLMPLHCLSNAIFIDLI